MGLKAVSQGGHLPASQQGEGQAGSGLGEASQVDLVNQEVAVATLGPFLNPYPKPAMLTLLPDQIEERRVSSVLPSKKVPLGLI